MKLTRFIKLNGLTTEDFLALGWEAQRQVESQPYPEGEELDRELGDEVYPAVDEDESSSPPADGSISVYHPASGLTTYYQWVGGKKFRMTSEQEVREPWNME